MRRVWSWRAAGCGLAALLLVAHGMRQLLQGYSASSSVEAFMSSPSSLVGAALILLAIVGLWGTTLE